MSLPFIDPDVFSAWGKLQHGEAFDKLSANEKAKVGRINELTDQFVKADKYIIVTPLWNLSIPPKMKTYIDNICVAGKTFKYTAQGPVGLMQGKTAVHIQASGGMYSQPPMNELEHGHRYIRGILNFLGINPVEAIMVEGLDLDPSKRPEITAKAAEQAKEVAKRFAKQTAKI
jgi:FMN-dependent NADH-azoreductase